MKGCDDCITPLSLRRYELALNAYLVGGVCACRTGKGEFYQFKSGGPFGNESERFTYDRSLIIRGRCCD